MKMGIYRHWKGHHYVTLFEGRDSNNHANREDVVIYMSLSAIYAGSINVRWKSEFLGEVELPSGELVPRFTYVEAVPRGPEPV